MAENVLQPLQVTYSAVTLATETVRSILKIDDVVSRRMFSVIIFSCINNFFTVEI